MQGVAKQPVASIENNKKVQEQVVVQVGNKRIRKKKAQDKAGVQQKGRQRIQRRKVKVKEKKGKEEQGDGPVGLQRENENGKIIGKRQRR